MQKLEYLQNVAQEHQNAEMAAGDIFALRMKDKMINVANKIEELEGTLRRQRNILTAKTKDEIEHKITVLKHNKDDIKSLIDGVDMPRRKKAEKRIKLSLIEENRVKKRKLGAGRKSLITESDEDFVGDAIEEHASVDGRRKEGVLYLARRLKQKDLLTIANYRMLQKGKQAIKSVTTVLNRGKPKNIRSKQAKQHKGKWLFCTKKPPKTNVLDKLHTRHQRQARKLVKHHAYTGARGKVPLDHFLVLSKDDKTYVRPGTSIGMLGFQNVGMIMHSDPEKQSTFSEHDFADKKFYMAPSSHRFMNKTPSGVKINGYDEMETINDTTIVTIRPKHFISSSGSVWASDYMKLRAEHPDLFEMNDNNSGDMSYALRQYASYVKDTVNYYKMTSVKQDFMNIIKKVDCKHREYEMQRLNTLVNRLENIMSEITAADDPDIKIADLFQETKNVQEAAQLLANDFKDLNINVTSLWDSCQNLQKMCQKVLEKIDTFGKQDVRPYVIEFTDGGAGVAVNNYEVRYREVEIAKLHDSVIRHRVHLATDDQGQNESERSNAYVGEAIADGRPVKTDYFDKHHGLSEEDKNSMDELELKKHEEKMLEKNIWCIGEDLKQRIDNEPGPGKSFMKAHLTDKKDDHFFSNTNALNNWRKSGKKKRATLPGHHYFTELEKQLNMHVHIGECYLEYNRYSDHCKNALCNICSKPPSPFMHIDPFPRPVPDIETRHYMTYDNTPCYKPDGSVRDPDDFQPRKQCNELFNANKLSPSMQDEIIEFSNKYLVKENTLKSYLMHKSGLKTARDKKKQAKTPATNKDAEDVQDIQETIGENSQDNTEDVSDDDNDDLVQYVVNESSSDEDTATIIPRVKSVTERTMNMSNLEQNSPTTSSSSSSFTSDNDSESNDTEINAGTGLSQCRQTYQTRSGRQATTWKSYRF